MAKNELNNVDRELLKKGIETYNDLMNFSQNHTILSQDELQRMEQYASYWQDCVDRGKELTQTEERILRQQIALAEQQKQYQLDSLKFIQEFGAQDGEIIAKNAALIKKAIEYNKAGLTMDMSGVSSETEVVIKKFTDLNGEYNKFTKPGKLDPMSARMRSQLDLLAKHQDALNQINAQVQDISDSSVQAQISAEKSLTSLNNTRTVLGYIRQVLGGVKNSINEATKAWRNFNDAAFKAGREMGMSFEQLRGYQITTIKNTRELAMAYGLAQDSLAKFQKQYTSLTQRNVLLNTTDQETVAGMSTLMGEESAMKLVDEFDKLGGSMSAASAWGMQMQNMAMKFGLSSKQSAEALAKSFQMANRYSFKNGISGLQRMVLQSQALRFNIEAASAAIDKASSWEGAIDMASRMQMLGGTYALQFSNPGQVLYEALNDAEAFTNRIINTVAGKANFNRKTGNADINPVDLAFMREMANATGVSFDELSRMARRSATNRAAVSEIQDLTIDKETREALANMSQYNAKTGQFEISYMTAEGEVTSALANVTKDMVDAIQSNVISDKMEDNVANIYRLLREEYLKRARESQSFNENYEGMKTGIQATIAQGANGAMNLAHDGVRAWGDSDLVQWGGGLYNVLKPTLIGLGSAYAAWKVKKYTDRIRKAPGGVGGGGGVAHAGGYGGGGGSMPVAMPNNRAGAAPHYNGYSNGVRQLRSGGYQYKGRTYMPGDAGFNNVRSLHSRGLRSMGGTGVTGVRGAASANRAMSVAKLGGRMPKGVGLGMAAGLLGTGIDIASDKLVESGKIERGGGADIAMGAAGGALSGAATGAMIGSIIPGIGTGIGAAIGAIAGGLFGAKNKSQQAAEIRAQALNNESAGAGINGSINLVVSGSVKLIAPNGASSDMMRAINDPAVRSQITDIVQRELRKRTASGTSVNMGNPDMQLQQGI